MIELYECPPVRSQRAKWALEELEIEHVSKTVNLITGEQNRESYRKIHPLGVVPVLKTNSYKIFESVAILMQLIDEHPEKNLAPNIGTKERATYYQWCIFACAEVDPALMMFFDNSMKSEKVLRPVGRQHNKILAEQGREDFEVRAKVLSNALSDRSYLLGEKFSGADIAIGHCLFMAKLMGLLEGFSVLETYYERLQTRPAYIRVYSRGSTS